MTDQQLAQNVETHWQARLADVQDALLVAHELDELVVIIGKLTNLIAQEFHRRDTELVDARVENEKLKILVRDAHRLLNDDLECLSWRDDVKDWTRAAKPFVQS